MIRKATSSSLMTKHVEQPTCSFGIRASEVGGRSLGGSRAGELPPYLQPDELRKAALFSRFRDAYLFSVLLLLLPLFNHLSSPATQLSLSLSSLYARMAWRGLAWQTEALGYGSAVVRPTPSNITYHRRVLIASIYSCNKLLGPRGQRTADRPDGPGGPESLLPNLCILGGIEVRGTAEGSPLLKQSDQNSMLPPTS